jgi:glucose/arabinose dehydrogenase
VAFSPDGAWLYASSDTTIWRWAYKKGDLVASGAPEVVVKSIPGGGNYTRTLVFDPQGRLYVNVGSLGNVDEGMAEQATRSMVRRFGIPNPIPAGGMDYAMGEVFASGLRNEVGLAFDAQGRMWGVENGIDGLTDTELGSVVAENPGEEINRLDGPGARFYGYPWCWTEFSIPDAGLGLGTQWRLDTISMANLKTDAWCRDTMNVHPPAYAMRGHSAPLGVTGYVGNSLPWKGDLFVTQHGPTGHIVGRAHLVGDTIQSFEPLVGKDDGTGKLQLGTWDARPVDVREGPDGALYFSDDQGGRVFRLGWKP